MSDHLNCREVIEFLMAYLDGELPAARQRVFEGHLGRCPPCVTYIETYRKTIALGRDALADCRDESLPEELIAAILAAMKQDA